MVLRLKFLNGLCMTGGRSLLRPWSPEQPAFSLVSSPVRILGRDAHRGCACPEAAEVTAQFVLEQGEPCVWWHVIVVTLFSAVAKGTALWRLRSWSRQRRLLTAPHGQGRGLPLGNALAFAGELDQEEFEGTDTGTVKNDSPSATVDSPRFCKLKIVDALESSYGRHRKRLKWLSSDRLESCGVHGFRRWRTLPSTTATVGDLSSPRWGCLQGPEPLHPLLERRQAPRDLR